MLKMSKTDEVFKRNYPHFIEKPTRPEVFPRLSCHCDNHPIAWYYEYDDKAFVRCDKHRIVKSAL